MLSYITGSSGFIGSHLSPKIKGDLVSIYHTGIKDALLEDYQYFYFLSSYGNHISQTSEFQTYKANIIDLIAILTKSLTIHPMNFVYLSSSSVMLRTQTVYSRAKKAAEEILLAHMEKNDVPVCIIRPFSVTGVGEQDTHLIPTLLRAAKHDEAVTLSPTPTHDFIDVDDVTDGIISLATHKARGIYQLGTGNKFSNLEVLHMVEDVTGKKLKTTFVDSMRPYDNEQWVSNNFKARSFGWLPKKQLRDSITEMWEAFN